MPPIRSRSSGSRPAPTASAPRSCTRSRTGPPPVDGSRRAAAATSGRASSRAPGRSHFAEMCRRARRPPRRAPGGVHRGGGAARGRRGPHDVLRAGPRSGPRRRRGARGRRRRFVASSSSHERPHEARLHARAGERHAQDGARARRGGRLGLPDQLLARHGGRTRASVSIVREVEGATGLALAVLADLPGPKVRLADVHPDPFAFRPGQRFELRPGGPATRRSRDHVPGARGRPPGGRSHPARRRRGGAHRSSGSRATACRPSACAPGSVRSHQGVNVPAERLGLPPVTDRDREMLRHVLELGVDLVAQSFVRDPSDIEQLSAAMGDRPCRSWRRSRPDRRSRTSSGSSRSPTPRWWLEATSASSSRWRRSRSCRSGSCARRGSPGGR